MFPERALFRVNRVVTHAAVSVASNIVAIGTLGAHSLWKLKGVTQAAIASLRANKLEELKKAAECVVDVVANNRHFYPGTPTCAAVRKAAFAGAKKMYPLYKDEQNDVLNAIVGKIGQAGVNSELTIQALTDLDKIFSIPTVAMLLTTSVADGWIEIVAPMLQLGSVQKEAFKLGAAGFFMVATGTFTSAAVCSYAVKRVAERWLTPSGTNVEC